MEYCLYMDSEICVQLAYSIDLNLSIPKGTEDGFALGLELGLVEGHPQEQLVEALRGNMTAVHLESQWELGKTLEGKLQG